MHFNKPTFLLKGVIVSAICLSLFACGNESTVEQENTNSGKDSLSKVKPPVQKEETSSFTLPSPLQIASIFKKSGLKYYPNITNPVDNAVKYTSGKTNEALNLGVYSADLSYCTLNKQNQGSKSYMKACRDIASLLGLGKVFESDHLASRFEKNLGNEDSLAAIIAEMQMQTDMILEENEQEYISATVFAGAWIESMYIGGKVFEKGKEKNISARLVEQMSIAENIIKALKVNEGKDPGISGVVSDMVAVRDIYLSFPGVKAMSGKDEELDSNKVTITDEEMKLLAEKIEDIRSKIVKG